MSIHFGFGPDPARARALDRRMNRELGSSLRHVSDQSRGVLPFDEPAIEHLVRSLADGVTYPPSVFGDYYALVDALLSEDMDAATAVFSQLAAAMPRSSRQSVTALEDPRTSQKAALYERLLTGDADLDIEILSPTPNVADAFRERYRLGIDLMERAVPELALEIQEIVHEVVCVASRPGRGAEFDGGSHFQLWGALFLNGDRDGTSTAMVEVLAHESAHSLLFGFLIDEPLVLNDDDERFESPLRPDPRPMDGIYHATYVSARMHYALSRLLESGLLVGGEEAGVREARARDHRSFEEGWRVMAEHGRLSEMGRKLMEGARDYMDAASE